MNTLLLFFFCSQKIFLHVNKKHILRTKENVPYRIVPVETFRIFALISEKKEKSMDESPSEWQLSEFDWQLIKPIRIELYIILVIQSHCLS